MSENGNGKISFGEFRLDTSKRVLWHLDRPIDLPPKAVDLLCLLVERRGDVVTKDEIWKHVWNDAFLEETNLTHNVYLLRKTLREYGAEDLIKTVPRRGYRFAGEITDHIASEIIYERATITDTLVEENTALDARPLLTRAGVTWTIGAALVVTIVVLGVLFRAGASSQPTQIGSIAVLPFRAFGPNADDEELRLRITDALITRLGTQHSVSISPTNSVVRFSGIETDPVSAGRELEVAAVLDGRVQTEGERVRVTVQLISVETGRQLWSGQFDGARTEILDLQDRIAVKLLPAITTEGQGELARNPTSNAEAYENYLKGRYLWNRRPAKDLELAVEYFERAIGLDPNFAEAYAGLADTYSQLANNDALPRLDGYQRARELALHALSLNPNLSEAHSSLGWIAYIHDWDWAEAERSFARAIELNPNNAEAHHWRALNLLAQGREADFVAAMEKARSLAPLTKPIAQNYYDIVRTRDGCSAAFEYLERFRSLHRISGIEEAELVGRHYDLCGEFDKAISVCEKVPADELSVKAKSFLAVAYARTGRTRQARRILDELDKLESTKKYYFRPYVYAALGDLDSAFADLERGIEVRDDRFVRLRHDDFFAALRSDSRFNDLLKKMNLFR